MTSSHTDPPSTLRPSPVSPGVSLPRDVIPASSLVLCAFARQQHIPPGVASIDGAAEMQIHAKYDLKGSTVNRTSKEGEKVLKDNNLREAKTKFRLGSQRQAFLKVGRVGSGGRVDGWSSGGERSGKRYYRKYYCSTFFFVGGAEKPNEWGWRERLREAYGGQKQQSKTTLQQRAGLNRRWERRAEKIMKTDGRKSFRKLCVCEAFMYNAEAVLHDTCSKTRHEGDKTPGNELSRHPLNCLGAPSREPRFRAGGEGRCRVLAQRQRDGLLDVYLGARQLATAPANLAA